MRHSQHDKYTCRYAGRYSGGQNFNYYKIVFIQNDQIKKNKLIVNKTSLLHSILKNNVF